ncbi:TRAP-type C4-dicarboxylate transport system, large permease component [Azospirillum argentinense]|uniref:TRAP transporter large permease n=1 Tax=Azospirillum argentinense TaxID=2970906 RepID=UPI0032DFE95D
MAVPFFAAVFVGLLVLSFPIFLGILVATITTFEVFGPALPSMVMAQRVVEGVNIFSLIAVPLFVFAADIIARGQIGARLVALVEAMVGHITGGLAIATVISCALFGAISGIGAAAVVSIGPIVYPSLLRQGYGAGFSAGLILAASTLSMLIPPGVAMILYSVQTSASVGTVFLAGLGAGILFTAILAIYAYFYARRHGIMRGAQASLPEIVTAARRAVWALGLPAVIFGGIYGGVFTPTEAAAAACVYAIVVECFIYRQLPIGDLFKVSVASGTVIATLLILIAVGGAMTWYLTLLQVPQQISGLLDGMSPWAILLVVNIVFLVAGMFIDPNSAIIVLSPLVYPAAMAAGIDPVHFGAVLVLNLAIGMITPPFGLNIFIGITTFKISYARIVQSLFPFIALAIITLLLATYVPITVMWPTMLQG